VLELLHDLVDLAPGDESVSVVVDLSNRLSDLSIRGHGLIVGLVLLDEALELVEVDVSIAVVVQESEDEIGPLSGALQEVEHLLLRDGAVLVGVDHVEDGSELSVGDGLATSLAGSDDLVLGELAVAVCVSLEEHVVDLVAGLLAQKALAEEAHIEEALHGLGLHVEGLSGGILLSTRSKIQELVAVVVLDRVVYLDPCEDPVVVRVEWLLEVPEFLAAALKSLGLSDAP